MKLHKKWQWENSWFAFTIVGLAIVPTLIAVVTIPDLWSIYTTVPDKTLVAMAFFGAGWGVNMVLFGLALDSVGLAITFAVSLGTSSAAGALVPLLFLHSAELMTQGGALILSGIVMIFVGVALCGVAGSKREHEAENSQSAEKIPTGRRNKKYLRGFSYAFFSGFLGSMLNFGLAFGGSIEQAAHERGASIAMMSNAVWLPCLYAGFIPGVAYCYYLMRKKHTLPKLLAPGTWHYWALAAAMGLLWYGSVILYSISTLQLGELGTSIGWPLFMSAIVIASTIIGVLIGEWSHSGKRPLRIMALGVACLVLAIGVLSQATR